MNRIAAAAVLLMGLGLNYAFGSSFDDLNAGIRLHNSDQWRLSLAAFDRALGIGGLSPAQTFIAHFDRGIAHQALGQLDEALGDYNASLALQPNSALALFERANIYMITGSYQKAGNDLDTLIAERPMLAQAYTMRSPISAKLHNVKQSVADARRSLSLRSEERGIVIGIVAWQAGEITTADDDFSYGSAQGQQRVYSWLWLALAQAKLGKPVPKEQLPDFDKSSWPAPIVNYFIGGASQDAIFAAAGQGEDFLTRGRICEANFYVGEWLLQHHDPNNARPMIQKAAEACPIAFMEWSPAQTEFAGLAQ